MKTYFCANSGEFNFRSLYGLQCKKERAEKSEWRKNEKILVERTAEVGKDKKNKREHRKKKKNQVNKNEEKREEKIKDKTK